MNRITTRRNPQIAFTLIELLVVVGIIAVTAAILFPVFAATRERGRRTQCLSNERQLGMAILQYAGDNNDKLFVAGANPHGFGYAGLGLGWAGKSYSYIKSVGVFRCPDDVTADVSAGESGSLNGAAMQTVSYGLNENLGGVIYPPIVKATPIPPVSLGQIAAPARTVLLFEVSGDVAALNDPRMDDQQSAWGEGNTTTMMGPAGPLRDASYPGGYSATPPGSPPLYVTGNMGGLLLNGATLNGIPLPGKQGSAPRHGEGANYAACDGHVAWLRPEQISPGFSAASADSPQVGRIGAAGTANAKYALTFSLK